jgi:hypothetical protein
MGDWRVPITTPRNRKQGSVSNSRNRRAEKLKRYPEQE